MDWLTFVKGVIDSTAWPLAAVTIACLFRSHIAALIPVLKRIKAGGFEAEFEHGVGKVQNELSSRPLPNRSSDAQGLFEESMLSLAEGTTREAVLSTWVKLEAEARSALTKRLEQSLTPGEMRSRPTRRNLASALHQAGVLSEREADILGRFQELTEMVEADENLELSAKTASKYIYSAAVLRIFLRKS